MQFNCENYTESDRDVQFTTAAVAVDASGYRCEKELPQGIVGYTGMYIKGLAFPFKKPV
jgi:hypothetical protein